MVDLSAPAGVAAAPTTQPGEMVDLTAPQGMDIGVYRPQPTVDLNPTSLVPSAPTPVRGLTPQEVELRQGMIAEAEANQRQLANEVEIAKNREVANNISNMVMGGGDRFVGALEAVPNAVLAGVDYVANQSGGEPQHTRLPLPSDLLNKPLPAPTTPEGIRATEASKLAGEVLGFVSPLNPAGAIGKAGGKLLGRAGEAVAEKVGPRLLTTLGEKGGELAAKGIQSAAHATGFIGGYELAPQIEQSIRQSMETGDILGPTGAAAKALSAGGLRMFYDVLAAVPNLKSNAEKIFASKPDPYYLEEAAKVGLSGQDAYQFALTKQIEDGFHGIGPIAFLLAAAPAESGANFFSGDGFRIKEPPAKVVADQRAREQRTIDQQNAFPPGTGTTETMSNPPRPAPPGEVLTTEPLNVAERARAAQEARTAAEQAQTPPEPVQPATGEQNANVEVPRGTPPELGEQMRKEDAQAVDQARAIPRQAVSDPRKVEARRIQLEREIAELDQNAKTKGGYPKPSVQRQIEQKRAELAQLDTAPQQADSYAQERTQLTGDGAHGAIEPLGKYERDQLAKVRKAPVADDGSRTVEVKGNPEGKGGVAQYLRALGFEVESTPGQNKRTMLVVRDPSARSSAAEAPSPTGGVSASPEGPPKADATLESVTPESAQKVTPEITPNQTPAPEVTSSAQPQSVTPSREQKVTPESPVADAAPRAPSPRKSIFSTKPKGPVPDRAVIDAAKAGDDGDFKLWLMQHDGEFRNLVAQGAKYPLGSEGRKRATEAVRNYSNTRLSVFDRANASIIPDEQGRPSEAAPSKTSEQSAQKEISNGSEQAVEKPRVAAQQGRVQRDNAQGRDAAGLFGQARVDDARPEEVQQVEVAADSPRPSGERVSPEPSNQEGTVIREGFQKEGRQKGQEANALLNKPSGNEQTPSTPKGSETGSSNAPKENANAQQNQAPSEPDANVQQQRGAEERQSEVPAGQGGEGIRKGGQEEAVAGQTVYTRDNLTPERAKQLSESQDTVRFKFSDLRTDPKRFQDRSDMTDLDTGGGGTLTGAKAFNEKYAGALTVWRDPADGETYVINGHNRYDRGVKSEPPPETAKVTFAPPEIKTAEEARDYGSLLNIAEGTFKPRDVAKVLKRNGADEQALRDMDVDVNAANTQLGVGLAKLGTEAWNRFLQGDISERRGAMIGFELPNEADQMSLLAMIDKKKGTVTDQAVAETIRNLKSTAQIGKGFKISKESGLFEGVDPGWSTYALDRGEVSAKIMARLSKEQKIFGGAKNENTAEVLMQSQVAKDIDIEKAGKLTKAAKANLAAYQRLSNRAGPINDILDSGARDVAAGQSATEVASRIYDRVKEELGREEGIQPERGRGDQENAGKAKDLFGSNLPTEFKDLKGEQGSISVTDESGKSEFIDAQKPEPIRDVEGQMSMFGEAEPKPASAADARAKLSESIQKFHDHVKDKLGSNLIFDPETIKLAADVAKNAVVAGVKTFTEFVSHVADIIGEKAAEKLKPLLQTEWDKAQGGGGEKGKEGKVIELDDSPRFAFKKAWIDEYRKENSFSDMPAPKRRVRAEVRDQALSEGYGERAMDVAADILGTEGGRAATGLEYEGMRYKAWELNRELKESLKTQDELQKSGNAESLKLEEEREGFIRDQIEMLHAADGVSRHIQSTDFSARQTEFYEDQYEAAPIMRRAKEAKRHQLTGRETTAIKNDIAEIERAKAAVAELEKKHKANIEKLEREFAEKLAKREVARARIRKAAAGTRERIMAERADLKKQLAATGLRMNTLVGPSPDQLFLIGKLAKNYLQGGANDLAEAAKLLIADFPELTDRDVYRAMIARDPSRQKKVRTEVERKISQAKTMARLLVDIDNAKAGIFSAPKEKALTPETIKTLQRKLRRLRNEAFKSQMEAVHLDKAVETINKLQDQLANNYREIKKSKKQPVSRDMAALKTQIRELQKLMRVEDRITSLNHQLETGEFEIKTHRPVIEESPELTRKRSELRRLQNRVDEHIENMKPKTARTYAAEVFGSLRAAKATGDMSATLRQALWQSVRHPVIASKAFLKSADAFFRENTAQDVYTAMVQHPNHYLRERAKLYLSPLEGKLTAREEQFQSRLLEKIPGLGKIVRASERHMVTHLNLIRTAVFDKFLESHPNATRAELEAMADYINVSTGRGNLGKSAEALSYFFFAPRFAVSRIQTPWSLIKHWDKPRVRAEIAKDMVAFAGAGGAALALASLAGAKVGLDPRDSDFGKIVIGDTHIDLWAGFQQPMRLLMSIGMVATDRMGITGQQLLDSEKTGDPVDMFERFLEFKASPAITIPRELFTGKSAVGDVPPPMLSWLREGITGKKYNEKKIAPEETLLRSVMPIVVESVADAFRKDGAGKAALTGALEFFGAGTSTYPKSEAAVRREAVKLYESGQKDAASAVISDWNKKHPKNKIDNNPEGGTWLYNRHKKLAKEQSGK